MLKVYKDIKNDVYYTSEDDIDVVRENGKTYLIIVTTPVELSPIVKYECGHFIVEKVEVEEIFYNLQREKRD